MGNLSNKTLIIEPIHHVLDQINQPNQCYVIAGPKGSGKSTVVDHLLATKENCLYLESSDFDFLCGKINEKEIIHFVELTLSKKIYAHLLDDDQKEEYETVINKLDLELDEFYQRVVLEEGTISKTYNFHEKTNEALKKIQKTEKEITLVFDDFHKIPRCVQDVVKKYNDLFDTGVITLECESSLPHNLKKTNLIQLAYSFDNQFAADFISKVLYHRGVNHLKDSMMSHEYKDKTRSQYLEILREGYLDEIIKRSNGNLHELKESVLGFISMINTNGYDYTQKTLKYELTAKNRAY